MISKGILRSVSMVPKNRLTRAVPTICQYAQGKSMFSLAPGTIP